MDAIMCNYWLVSAWVQSLKTLPHTCAHRCTEYSCKVTVFTQGQGLDRSLPAAIQIFFLFPLLQGSVGCLISKKNVSPNMDKWRKRKKKKKLTTAKCSSRRLCVGGTLETNSRFLHISFNMKLLHCTVMSSLWSTPSTLIQYPNSPTRLYQAGL